MTILQQYNIRNLPSSQTKRRVTTCTYDSLGRLLTITRPNGTVRTNLYDIASRLISYQERTATGDLIAYGTFGYDNDDRILSRYRIPNYATAVGTAALPTAAPQPSITNATYDDDNRLTNVTLATVPAGGGTASTTSFAIAHDLDGNMTNAPLLPAVTASGSPASVPALTSHTYDARNRLTNIAATTNRPSYSYTYDAENNRLSQTVTTSGTAQTTRYTFDPHGDALPRVLIRTKPNGEKTFYIYGIGLLYEINTNAETTTETSIRYYHYDNLGSTIALTAPRAASGDTPITDRTEYDFHGRTLYRTGTTDTPFLYVGQFGIQTDSTGLHHMRARYYSPLLLRFISADPLGFAAGSNFYAYANNSPLLYIDPSGLCPSSDKSEPSYLGYFLYNADSSYAGLTHGHNANVIQHPDGNWWYITSDKDNAEKTRQSVAAASYASLDAVRRVTMHYETAIEVKMTAEQAKNAIELGKLSVTTRNTKGYALYPNPAKGEWNCSTLSVDIMNVGGANFEYGSKRILVRGFQMLPSDYSLEPASIQWTTGGKNWPKDTFEVNKNKGKIVTWGDH